MYEFRYCSCVFIGNYTQTIEVHLNHHTVLVYVAVLNIVVEEDDFNITYCK